MFVRIFGSALLRAVTCDQEGKLMKRYAVGLFSCGNRELLSPRLRGDTRTPHHKAIERIQRRRMRIVLRISHGSVGYLSRLIVSSPLYNRKTVRYCEPKPSRTYANRSTPREKKSLCNDELFCSNMSGRISMY